MLHGALELGLSGTKDLQNNNSIHDYGCRKCNSLSLIDERNLGPSASCPYSTKCVEGEFSEVQIQDRV
jgi:hypothetical protein